MKSLRMVVLIGLCLSMAACSKIEIEPAAGAELKPGAKAEVKPETKPGEADNTKTGTRFLAENEIPVIEETELVDDGSNFAIELVNRKGASSTTYISRDPGETPVKEDMFYSVICGKKVLVIVIRQAFRTGLGGGKYYYNRLINPVNGNLLADFRASKVTSIIDDKGTEEFYDDQTPLLAKLKAGGDLGSMCDKLRKQ